MKLRNLMQNKRKIESITSGEKQMTSIESSIIISTLILKSCIQSEEVDCDIGDDN